MAPQIQNKSAFWCVALCPLLFSRASLADVFDKFRKQVEVFGLIHYRKNGTPISIEAEHIVRLPDDSELPTAGDGGGIPAIGGMPSEPIYTVFTIALGLKTKFVQRPVDKLF